MAGEHSRHAGPICILTDHARTTLDGSTESQS